MHEPDLPIRRRRAVRLLLLDDDDRILLLLGRDPAVADGPTWWFTPGGGIQPGEDLLAAVRREAWEELGHVPGHVRGPLAHRRYEFSFDAHWLVQDTDYFWERVAAFEPSPTQLTDVEQRYILGWRWWPRAALAETGETIYPTDLPELLDLARG